jgi:phospholipase/carboxylesterase
MIFRLLETSVNTRRRERLTRRIPYLFRVLGVFVPALVACRAPPSAQSTSSNPPPVPAPSISSPAPATTPEVPASTSSGVPAATIDLEYVEIMTGGAGAEDREPLVIALHGLGDRPESFVHVFEGFAAPARIVAPHSATAYYDGYSWFPFHKGDPDFSAPGIAKAAEQLARFATGMASKRPTAGKPIVTGFSQGGALSFALAARHPESFAAAFPLSGWFPATLWPKEKPRGAPPIVAFHGTADSLVPITRMRPGAKRLAELGFSIDVRELDGVGHTIPAAERVALFDALEKACERERAAR